MKTVVDLISEAVAGAVKERRRSRSPSERRSARRARGRPSIELSLPQEVVDALRSYSQTTGEPMSRIVEDALRIHLSVGR